MMMYKYNMEKLEINRVNKVFFLSVSIICIIGAILFFPKYIHLKFLSGTNSDFLLKIHLIFINNTYGLKKYYQTMRNNIPDQLLIIEIIINIINMIFGFIYFKNRWWYYVILLICILISVMLIDCWWLLHTAE